MVLHVEPLSPRIFANIKRRPGQKEELLALLLPLVLLAELVELLYCYELGCSHHLRSWGPCYLLRMAVDHFGGALFLHFEHCFLAIERKMV